MGAAQHMDFGHLSARGFYCPDAESALGRG